MTRGIGIVHPATNARNAYIRKRSGRLQWSLDLSFPKNMRSSQMTFWQTLVIVLQRLLLSRSRIVASVPEQREVTRDDRIARCQFIAFQRDR
jgi:hypothetical protein